MWALRLFHVGLEIAGRQILLFRNCPGAFFCRSETAVQADLSSRKSKETQLTGIILRMMRNEAAGKRDGHVYEASSATPPSI